MNTYRIYQELVRTLKEHGAEDPTFILYDLCTELNSGESINYLLYEYEIEQDLLEGVLWFLNHKYYALKNKIEKSYNEKVVSHYFSKLLADSSEKQKEYWNTVSVDEKINILKQWDSWCIAKEMYEEYEKYAV